MTDPVILLCASALSAGAFLAFRSASREVSSAGGTAETARKILSLHRRFAARLFSGRLGDVPGREMADPSRALLAGNAAFLPLALLAVTRWGAPSIPLLPLAWGASALPVGRASMASQGRRAIDEVRADLPGASFLLALLLDSGLSVASAMPEVLSSVEGRALHGELSALQSSRAMGADPRVGYGRAMERVREENYHAFLSILQQGERVGAGLSRSLSELASRMLDEDAARAETQAQKAPVRMLAPLVFCFFPSVALLILSPVLLPILTGELLP